ncbi:MAG TPA: hypothetical protein VMU54_09875 [Planctomycetota bacterium]|nr:hypothetical protein [Planctomycetota bacterium]
MRKARATSDPDIIGSFAALKRAARSARRIAIEANTPLYVWKDGRVVNLNPIRRKPGSQSKGTR